MKKLLSMLAIVAVFFSITSCGNDEPKKPEDSQKEVAKEWYNVKTSDAIPTIIFNTTPNAKGEGTVRLNGVKFSARGHMSPALNIRIDAPLKKNDGVFTYEGTELVPYLKTGNTEVPYDEMKIQDFKAVVDVKKKTYTLTFKAHGGEFNSEGTITDKK